MYYNLRVQKTKNWGFQMDDVCQAFGSPWLTFALMESGDMVFDRNTGELVPAEQIVDDPLRFNRVSRLNGCEHEYDLDDDDDFSVEGAGVGIDEEIIREEEGDESSDSTPSFDEDYDDIDIIDPAAVMAAPCLCSSKARHDDAGNDKLDGERRYRFFCSHGRHGRQIYKDRKLRMEGSGRTRPVNAIW